MPSWFIALLLAVGVTAWSYNKLAHINGNATPSANMLLAAGAGFIVFIICFSFIKSIFNF